jgi:hypothetical protein
VGFEFEDTSNGKPCGKGLMGFKIYDYEKKLSETHIRDLFNMLFGAER